MVTVAGRAGHGQVQQDDVRLDLRRPAQGLGAVRGLGDDLHVGLGLDEHPQAGAEDRVVVGDQNADARHARYDDCTGKRAVIVVPCPRAEAICTAPPSNAARSCMP